MPSQSPSATSSPESVSLFLPPRKPLPSSSPSPSSPSDSPSSEATSSLTTGLPTDDWSAGSGGAETSGPGPSESSAPPSTGELPKGSLAGRGELATAAAAGVVMATTAAHEMLADDDGKAMGQYLAEDEEVEHIADAVSGLISRRVPPGMGNPDLGDLVKLAFVVGGYVARQFQIRRALKAARRGAILGAPLVEDQGDVVEPYSGPVSGR